MKDEKGKKQYWLIVHCTCDLISKKFHEWIERSSEGDRGFVYLNKLYNSRAYNAMENLAQRHCSRLMYNISKVLKIKVKSIPDVMAYKKDEREELPMMVEPDLMTKYNYLEMTKLEGKNVIMLMNKTTCLQERSGTFITAQPLSPTLMYDFRDGIKSNSYGKTIYNNDGMTVPVSLGKDREMDRFPVVSQMEYQKAKKWFYWEGKNENLKPPRFLFDKSHKQMNASRKRLLMKEMGLPEPLELYPCMIVIPSK